MSHISLEVVNIAMQNQVHLLCLPPPHCSYLLQPLDVGVFKPVKDEWRKTVKDWYKDSRMKHIDKGQFSKLLRKLHDSMKPQLAISGFAKCSIYPFDPTVIASDKLAPAETFEKELASAGQKQVSCAPDVPGSSGENQNTVDMDARSALPVPSCNHTPPESPCTPHTGMRKAVLAQLKVCNAAVRKTTARRKIAKLFGGECLTEDESMQRLNDSVEKS